MGAFLGTLSTLGFFVFLILTLVSVFKRNGKAKRFSKGLIVTFVLFIVAIIISPKTSTDSNTENKSATTSQTNNSLEIGKDNEVDKGKITSNSANAEINVTNKVSGNLKVHYINVGQADSILIQQNDKNMLIDAGNNGDSDLVVNYLKQQGVSKLDYVIGTHPHEDHIGGLDVVIKTFNIGTIFMPKITTTTDTYKDVLTAISSKGMKVTSPQIGSTFNLGDAVCTVLAPNSTSYEDLNNYSVAIKLKYGNSSFIFMGDAESISEGEILAKQLDIKGDVLKIGHHGSSSSTSETFLNKVNPKYAIISVGKGNDYGHPHKPTMDKLKVKGIEIYRTDECGTIVATSDGTKITFSTKPGSYAYSGTGSNSGSSTNTKTSSNSTKTNNTMSQPVKQVQPQQSKNVTKDITVYITDTGTKYHRDGCSSLNKSKYPISLSEAKSQGYGPCGRCHPPQ